MEPGSPLYSCLQVREFDRRAIESAGIPAFELMTRAARAALQQLAQAWPSARSVAIACGAGNNGGDGFVLARLAREAGYEVRVFATQRDGGTPEARRAAQEWSEAGGAREALASLPQAWRADSVFVDAIFGIGLDRAPHGEAAVAIEAINACGRPVLALDVPSGLDAERGCAAGVAVRASRTLTFIADKRGLHTGQARDLCGAIALAGLELPEVVNEGPPAARLLLAAALAYWLPRRRRDVHKGHHGRVLAVGGDHGYPGAIRLCAEAALRTGAGHVGVATRGDHLGMLLASRPEALAHAVEEPAALTALLAGGGVVALGPGLGQGDWGRALFDAAIEATRDVVIDADALNLLAQAPRPVPGAVLTPHPGEAARLLGASAAQVERDRFAAAQEIAERYDASIVLKGAGSVVAAPGRIPAVIGAGNPGMATAGMGDVLTGVIAALRAQGLDGFDAACAGALLHACAGDVAAGGGERGLLASDLFLPLRELANPA